MIGKRGQVTMFVIVGIIIVAAAVTVFVYQRGLERSKLASAEIEAAAVPPKALVVKEFVDQCINQVAKEGTEILGERAGYIEIPEDNLANNNFNFFSNSLEIFSGEGVKVPYWWYEAASTVEKSQVPSLSSMSLELEKYIDDNIDDCLNFEIFEGNGYKFRTAPFVAEVEILENTVAVKGNYELYMEIDDFEFRFSVFYEEVEVPLGELYKASVDIYNYEISDMFLENKTLDYFVVYEELPYSGVDLDCSPKTWLKNNVIADLREILEANVPMYRVRGTEYGDSERYYEINALKGRNNFNVNFMYSKQWPLLIDFVGEDSELLRGEPYTTGGGLGGFVASLFCMNNYHFVYDLKYPVLVQLEKDDYVFQYALQVVIDNNQPRENRALVDYSDQLDSFLCDKTTQEMNVYVSGRERGQLEQLEDAQVSFKCSTASCEMGYTFVDRPLTANFPQCVNGFIFSYKDGYHRGKEMITTTEPGTISLIMDKLKNLNVEVMVIDDNGERSLAEGEIAFFNLENVEEEFGASVAVPELSRISLIPGNYFVKGFLMAESRAGFKFEEQEIEHCFDVPRSGVLGVFGAKETKCVESKIEGVELNSIITGRIEYEWSVGDTIYDVDKIVFYIKKGRTPRNMQEMIEVQGAEIKEEDIRRPSLR